MRTTLLALLTAAAVLSTVAETQALSLPVVARDGATAATPVRDGCGPYRYRDRRGFCHRFYR